MTKKFLEVWNERVLGNKEDLEIGLAQLETEIRVDERKKVFDEVLKEAFKEIEQRIADGKKEKDVYLNKWDLKCIAKRVKETKE